MIIFKMSILRIPGRKISRPHSYPEKRFDFVRKLWFSELGNDYGQDLILFCQTLTCTIFTLT